MISIESICNLLNEVSDADPALVSNIVNTMWKAEQTHADVEYVAVGPCNLTSFIGVLNGILRSSNAQHRIAIATNNGQILFIPEKLDV